MDFCLRMINNVLHEESEKGFPKNVTISPLSISLMINMVTASTKAHRLDGLLMLLGAKNVEDINTESSKLLALASDNNSGGPELYLASAVFADQRRTLKPSFEQLAKRIYEAQIKPVDFANKPEEVVDEINSWIKKATKGLIPSAGPNKDDPFLQLTLLYLVNAMYFKGGWETPFDPSSTTNHPFDLLNGDTIMTQTMCEYYEYYDYGEFDGYRTLRLFYRCGEDKRTFYMYFFLPDLNNGLKTFLQKVKNEPGFFTQDFDLLETKIDKLRIPKFKLFYKFDLSKACEKMGFVHPSLDELEIFDEAGGRDMIMTHRAYVEVDEKGTEAAAVTSNAYIGCCLKPPPPVYFHVDRPFVFMIREEESLTPFFIGVVVDPRSESLVDVLN